MTVLRLALIALLVLVLTPLVNLVLTVPVADLVKTIAAPESSDAARTSLFASMIAVGGATILGVPAGYVLARTSGGWRIAMLTAFSVPLALPPVASGVVLLGLLSSGQPVGAFLSAHGWRIVDTLLGVAVAEFFVAGSIVVIAATAAFSGVERRLEEAARTLGAGPLRVLFTVALPLAAPGIAAGVLLAWLRAIGEYGATSLVAYHPTSLPIFVVIALSADGVPHALALSEALAAMTVLTIVVASLAGRRTA